MNEKIIITPKAPFNFELCGQIFSHGHPKIRKFEGGRFWQLIRLNGSLLLIDLESKGSTENPQLILSIESLAKLDKKDLTDVIWTVNHIYNLDLDLNHFYHEIGNDGVIEHLINKLRGLKNPLTPTIFESLVDSIIEQQISLKVAHILQNRMIKKFGDSLNIKGVKYYTYPTPQNLSMLDPADLRACGLTFRKAEYITDLSRDIVNEKLDLEDMKKINETPDLLEEMCRIRGVGIWTAELAVLRSLGRFDVIPGDDIALRRIMSSFYLKGETVSPAKAREIASAWDGWKGLAAYYLEVAELMNISI